MMGRGEEGWVVNVREVRNEAVRSGVVNGAERQVDGEEGRRREAVVRGRRGDERENNNSERSGVTISALCSQKKCHKVTR